MGSEKNPSTVCFKRKSKNVLEGTPSRSMPPFSKRSMAVDHLALAPRTGHLQVDVVHDASFRSTRPFFVRGDQSFHGGLQESPFGLVEKARGYLGRGITEQRGSLSCQRGSRNRD